jgi:pimeloyl-ACP methyl ester carboxylesterase
VGLAPIADLLDYDRYTRCGPRAATRFLGEDPALRGERFRLSDPISLGPSEAPSLVLFGEADPIVPPDHGRAYEERATAAGQAVERVTVPAAGHFELVAPWTAPWADVERMLSGFLGRVTGGGAAGSQAD